MDIKDIFKQRIQFVRNSGVSVIVTTSMPWVDIRDSYGNYAFLQDDSAYEFIGQIEEWEKDCPDMIQEEYALAVAYDYLDLLTTP